MTTICSDDQKITLPIEGKATIEQCREQGRFVGLAYGQWFVEREKKLVERGRVQAIYPSFDECGVYLLNLNAKMQPVFKLSDDQMTAFNDAAIEGYGEFMRPYIVANAFCEGINEVLAPLGVALDRIARLSSTAMPGF